jgi:hypothetical protein
VRIGEEVIKVKGGVEVWFGRTPVLSMHETLDSISSISQSIITDSRVCGRGSKDGRGLRGRKKDQVKVPRRSGGLGELEASTGVVGKG